MTSEQTEQMTPEDDGDAGGSGVNLTPGTVLDHGRYRLLAQVGADTRCNAQLWRAKDGVLGRDVALTVLVGDRSDTDAAAGARRTLERAMHASTFNHLGVARVLDVVAPSPGDPDGVLGIVIAEWTHGTDLVELVENGPLAPGTAARLLQPLAAAVEAGHHAGLVLGVDHPQRIRVTPEGEVRMAFPGPLAHATSNEDVAGLGAVLYLMLTARWPLAGAPGGLSSAPLGQDGGVVPPRTLRPTVPMELSTVASRALGPVDNSGTTGGVRTGAAVLRVLEQHATDEHSAAVANAGASSTAVWSTDDPKPDRAKRKKLVLSVSVLGVATLLVVGWIAASLIGVFTDPVNPGDSQVIDESGNASDGTSTQPPPPAEPLAVSQGTAYNDNGEPDAPHRIPNLYDGDPSTAWKTFDYFQQLGPGGISNGTGAVLTLDRPAVLGEVTINSPSAGAQVEIRTVDGEPALDGGRVLGSATLQDGRTTIPIEAAQPTDRVLVVLTKLAESGGNYSAEIGEIEVTGSAG
ncbi:protein kinase family protein [Salinifilum ghardaiensis]